jgi:assimilatory nitrate reductase catalytic subunit
MILNTGRVRDHWHTMTRTGKSARLSQHLAEPYAEIHPLDAAGLQIADADIVSVSTAHGSVLVRALLSTRQARGAVFVPMHWTDQFSASARIGVLLPSLTDPISGQPASKHGAARVERFSAATYGFAVLREKPHALNADYWAIARCDGGWRLELAVATGEHDWAAFAARLFCAPPGSETSAYHDLTSGQQRFACFDGERLVGALFLAAGPVAVSRDWAVEQLNAKAVAGARLAIIAGRPGRGNVDRGATVCSCFNIGTNDIAAAVKRGCSTVAAVGDALLAGTNCGSCRAEIRAIIESQRLQAAE